MKNYIIYELSTGQIEKTGCCQDKCFNSQATEGLGVIEGVANDVTQFIDLDDLAIITKTNKVIQAEKDIKIQEQKDRIVELNNKLYEDIENCKDLDEIKQLLKIQFAR